MTGKLIAPEYHIRLFTKTRGVLNFNNVTNISVTEEVNDVGSFSITLDYRDGLTDDLRENEGDTAHNLLNIVSSMDYVEIYLRNQLPTREDGSIVTYSESNVPAGFGIFGENQEYLHPFEYVYEDKKWNYDPTKQEPLDIINRINNPDLVMCGFVRDIQDNFSMQGGTPTTSITLTGQGVGVFLKLHQLYFGSITEDAQIKEFESQWFTIALTIEETIKYILADLMAKTLSSGFKYITKKIENPSEGDTLLSRFVQVSDEGDLKGKTGTYRVVTKENKEDTVFKDSYVYITDQKPSFSQIYWGEQSVKENESLPRYRFPWGRIQKIQYGLGITKHSISNKVSVWEAIYKNAGIPFNEFWVDRTGNVVFRRMIDAVNQGMPKYDKKSETVGDNDTNVYEMTSAPGYEKTINPNTGEVTETKVWKEIDTNELISWNLRKTDDELSTFVIGNLEADTTGKSGILLDFIRAPITEGALKLVKEQLKNQENPLQDLATIIEYIDKLQPKQFAGTSLVTEGGLKKFWQTYGVRVEEFLNFTSQDPVDGFIDTQLLFLYRLFNLYKGTITIVGNPRIRAGTVVYVKRINATFYVKSATHTYTFGEEMTTTLEVVNGRIQDTFDDPYLELREVLEKNIEEKRRESGG